MAILVGFHTEGWDHLILRAYLAKLLELAETEIQPDWIEGPGRGWSFVVEVLPKALTRFYGQCAQFAVIGIDNDGNVDIDTHGIGEDPAHPRHWLHPGTLQDRCRWCQLSRLVDGTRARLNWLPRKPGRQWPVLVALPVEAIEAWLIITRAVVHGRPSEIRAEAQARRRLKRRFYGKPAATQTDVEMMSLPLIRSMTDQHMQSLRRHSNSFAQFADLVEEHRETILGHRDCWAEGDRAAER